VKACLLWLRWLLPVCLLLQACSAAPRFGKWELPREIGFAVLSDHVLIEPLGEVQSTAVMFYPGALVDPSAYLPTLAPIAAQGYRVVIARMPLDLAVLNSDKALELMPKYPYVQHWVLAGHSLGGAMAAELVKRYPERFTSLVLMAAYPGENTDLSGVTLPVMSIYASEDGLATPAKIESAKPRLPAETRYACIKGGNHAQFGTYGPQQGDGLAAEEMGIFRQQKIIASEVFTFLVAGSTRGLLSGVCEETIWY